MTMVVSLFCFPLSLYCKRKKTGKGITTWHQHKLTARRSMTTMKIQNDFMSWCNRNSGTALGLPQGIDGCCSITVMSRYPICCLYLLLKLSSCRRWFPGLLPIYHDSFSCPLAYLGLPFVILFFPLSWTILPNVKNIPISFSVMGWAASLNQTNPPILSPASTAFSYVNQTGPTS